MGGGTKNTLTNIQNVKYPNGVHNEENKMAMGMPSIKTKLKIGRNQLNAKQASEISKEINELDDHFRENLLKNCINIINSYRVTKI